MTSFPNVNRALLFGLRAKLCPNEDFPLESAELPEFVALPMGTGCLPTPRGREPPRVRYVPPEERDMRRLFPSWVLDSFATPPTLNVSDICTSLANMAVTIPQLMLYERRGGTNYVKNHMLPASLAVAVIILYDLGDLRRAQALCEHVCPEAFATGKSLALAVLTCLNNFYATTRRELPTHPQEAEKFNADLAGSALHLIDSPLFPSAFLRLSVRTICLSLGATPALRFQLSLPASIVLLNVMFSESALWAKDMARWAPTFPSALSLNMNRSLPSSAHAVFNARMMPTPTIPSKTHALWNARMMPTHTRRVHQDAEIPIPLTRTLTNLVAIAASVLHVIRRRHAVLSAAHENGAAPPLPSNMASLMTNLMMPSADIERISTITDDELYLSHLAGATVEEVLQLFIFRDTVTAHDLVGEVLDRLSPSRPVNPLCTLDARRHLVSYAAYVANPDMRGLACLDPQMIARAHGPAEIAAIIKSIQEATFPSTQKPATPVWSRMTHHRPLETTALRALAPGSVPICSSKSPLSAIAHVATLRGYTLVDKLSPDQLRYMALIRYLARHTHQSCLLGASDRLFDLETDSASGCALMTLNAMRVLVLHMAYYSKHQYWHCSNTMAVPIARELLCLPPLLGAVLADEGDARFVDELSAMIVLNLTRYSTKSVLSPLSAALPVTPRYGFTRLRLRYKKPGCPEPDQYVSGLALPLLEYLVRPLLTGDHVNHRESFSAASGADVIALSEWMTIMSEIRPARFSKMCIPSRCIEQLIIRFAYVVRAGQLSTASGALTRAGVICNQNGHMVHAIMMLTLSMYNAEHGIGSHADGMERRPRDDFMGYDEYDNDEEAARELASANYDNARAYSDDAKTRPLWSARHNSVFLSKFYSIPLEWFSAKILTSNEALQRMSQPDSFGNQFSCAIDGLTERAAAMSAMFGICFGDAGSLRIGQRAGEKDIAKALAALPNGPERSEMIDELEAAAGRRMPKISREPGSRSASDSKRQKWRNPRKTSSAKAAELNYSIIDSIYAFGGKIAAGTKEGLERYVADYENLDEAHLLFERLCRDHNIVTGPCPRAIELYYSIICEQYRDSETLARWIYLFHLMAFVLSWSLHADRPNFASFSGSGQRIDVVPPVLFRTVLHSMKMTASVGKFELPHRIQIDEKMAKVALNVTADAPPLLFDGSSPWTLRSGTSSDAESIKRVVMAVAWLEASAHSTAPNVLIRSEFLSLPSDWLGAALPMIINKKLVRYGVDWPSLKLTEAEFKEKYFDLAESEELRNVSFLMNNNMPFIGVSRTKLTPLRASAPHVVVFDPARRCAAGCLANELPVGQKNTDCLLELVHIARKDAASAAATGSDPMVI